MIDVSMILSILSLLFSFWIYFFGIKRKNKEIIETLYPTLFTEDFKDFTKKYWQGFSPDYYEYKGNNGFEFYEKSSKLYVYYKNTLYNPELESLHNDIVERERIVNHQDLEGYYDDNERIPILMSPFWDWCEYGDHRTYLTETNLKKTEFINKFHECWRNIFEKNIK